MAAAKRLATSKFPKISSGQNELETQEELLKGEIIPREPDGRCDVNL